MSSPNMSLRVSELEPGSSAAISGVVEEGDELLKVNNGIVEKLPLAMLKDKIMGR